MQKPIDKNDPVQQARIACMAAMETANLKRARTVVKELIDVNKDAGYNLAMDVVRAYGVSLL